MTWLDDEIDDIDEVITDIKDATTEVQHVFPQALTSLMSRDQDANAVGRALDAMDKGFLRLQRALIDLVDFKKEVLELWQNHHEDIKLSIFDDDEALNDFKTSSLPEFVHKLRLDQRTVVRVLMEDLERRCNIVESAIESVRENLSDEFEGSEEYYATEAMKSLVEDTQDFLNSLEKLKEVAKLLNTSYNSLFRGNRAVIPK
jgi:hypothetical protein